ncbi:Na+/H+ antiporter subunit E [Ruicaihuangia caeni]|uniref:Na+/H+ antiporter subunit E n=1 Tax=Ruicaihuangia caeni TaxID=3042517 RepID=A0AAW6T5J9_9MICO|nr:Na+/H+ antiporter subunit E [Klugiella sp. YN-L-19]MDI2097360.1 Na+/H+ antiporter subunit E [Klugiella sp. YN-L-19]
MSPAEHGFIRRLRLRQLPVMIGLVVFWLMLWGDVTALNVVVGVVLAIIVTRVFYLPPVDISGRVNPWWLLRYLGYFLRELVIASFQVAFLALDPRGVPHSSFVRVKLRTKSDFILTMVGMTISLIPGSLVAEVDRYQSTLYLHVLNTRTLKDVEAMRREVRWIEELLIRAVGDRNDLRRLGA